MSRDRYPRIESLPSKYGSNEPCVLCESKPTGRVWIQTTYMRGEDESEWVCAQCRKLTDLLDRIMVIWQARYEAKRKA